MTMIVVTSMMIVVMIVKTMEMMAMVYLNFNSDGDDGSGISRDSGTDSGSDDNGLFMYF